MGPLCSSFLGAFLGLALLLAGSDPRLSSHAVGELSVDSFDQSFPTLSLEWEDSYKLLHFQVHMISVGHGLTVVVSSEIFQICRLFLVPLTKKLLITVTHHYHCCPVPLQSISETSWFYEESIGSIPPCSLRHGLLSLAPGTQLISLPPVLPLLVLHRKTSPSLLPLIFYSGSTLLSGEKTEHLNVFPAYLPSPADLAPPAFLKQLPPWDTLLPSLVLTPLALSLLYDPAQFIPSNSPFLQPSLGLGLPHFSSHSSGSCFCHVTEHTLLWFFCMCIWFGC